jgi:hypothetical protein
MSKGRSSFIRKGTNYNTSQDTCLTVYFLYFTCMPRLADFQFQNMGTNYYSEKGLVNSLVTQSECLMMPVSTNEHNPEPFQFSSHFHNILL